MRILLLALASCVLLPGCSNHPLVDDRTDLSTREVIQKVRCEAREKIDEHLGSKGYETHNRFEALRGRISEGERTIKYRSPETAQIAKAVQRIDAAEKAAAAEEDAKGNELDRQLALLKVGVQEATTEASSLLKQFTDLKPDQLDLMASRIRTLTISVEGFEGEIRRIRLRKLEIVEEKAFA